MLRAAFRATEENKGRQEGEKGSKVHQDSDRAGGKKESTCPQSSRTKRSKEVELPPKDNRDLVFPPAFIYYFPVLNLTDSGSMRKNRPKEKKSTNASKNGHQWYNHDRRNSRHYVCACVAKNIRHSMMIIGSDPSCPCASFPNQQAQRNHRSNHSVACFRLENDYGAFREKRSYRDHQNSLSAETCCAGG